MSPDGQNIVTGAGDETLRFWSAFPSSNKGKSSLDCGGFGISSMSQIYPSSMDIRWKELKLGNIIIWKQYKTPTQLYSGSYIV